jgi:D-galactarolactone cycloisomerase
LAGKLLQEMNLNNLQKPSRRKFIQESGIALSGMAILPSLVSGSMSAHLKGRESIHPNERLTLYPGKTNLKVTRVEVIRSAKPIALPEPWLPAWDAPDGRAMTVLNNYAFYKVYTNEGIVGIGPYTNANPDLVVGIDPFTVGSFWETNLSGRRAGTSGKSASGLEIALWDIIGKATGQPIHKLLGSCHDRMMVYAATSRLLDPAQHSAQALELIEQGFKAIKLRLHRPDPRNDLLVVEAVRKAVGDKIILLVDANQNNPSKGYSFWSRYTALQMAQELDKLGVYCLEEPLPRIDIEGLVEITSSVDMFIAGGEHSSTIYDFKEHIMQGAYDILQPDVVMGGNMGIIGLRKVAEVADYFGRLVIPHVWATPPYTLGLSATLQALATVENCPMVEYPYDPPVLTVETMQPFVREPILVEKDGCVRVPNKPGLGVEIDEDKLLFKS